MFDYMISFSDTCMHTHTYSANSHRHTHMHTHTQAHTRTQTLCPSVWNLNSGRLISVLPAVLLPETLELKCSLTKWQEIKWDHMKKIAILTHFTCSFLSTYTHERTQHFFFLMLHSFFASRRPFHLFSASNKLSVLLSFSIQSQLSKQSWSSRLLTIYLSLVFRFHACFSPSLLWLSGWTLVDWIAVLSILALGSIIHFFCIACQCII